MHGTTYSFDGSAWNVLTNENGGTLDLTNYYTKTQVDNEITTANSGGIPTYKYDKVIVTNTTDTITLPVPHNTQTVSHVKKFIAGDTVTDTQWDFDTGDTSSWDFNSSELNLHDGKIKVKGVDGDAKVIGFDASNQSSYIVLSDGTLLVSGKNNYYQLGLNNSIDQQTFVVSAITNVIDVHCGDDWAILLLRDGTIKSVGYNQYGYLGSGDTVNQESWTTSPITNVYKINGGEHHCVALKNDGTVWTCGYNYYGQLGLGHTTNTYTWTEVNYNNVPRDISATIIDIAAGYQKTIILCEQNNIGKCYFTGYGYLGQNGRAHSYSDDNYSSFTYMDYPGTRNVKKVECGWDFNLFLMKDGTCNANGRWQDYAYGITSWNQVGGSYGTSSYGQAVWWTYGFESGVADIACSYTSTMLLLDDGTVKGCGNNSNGQLGLGHTTTQSSYTVTSANATHIFGSGWYNFLLFDNVGIKISGDNDYGQAGTNNKPTDAVLWTVPNHPVVNDIFYGANSGYCKSLSSVNLLNADTINSISITDTITDGSDIKYALSFDGKLSWVGTDSIYTDTVVSTATGNVNLATDSTKMWASGNDGAQSPELVINGLGSSSTNQGWWSTTGPFFIGYDFTTPTYLDTIRIQPFVGTTDNFKITRIEVYGNNGGVSGYDTVIIEDYSTARHDEIVVSFSPKEYTAWKIVFETVSGELQIESIDYELNADVVVPLLSGTNGNKVITDISTEGNLSDALALYDFTGFSGNTLDVGIYMSNTLSDVKVSPAVDQITIDMSVNGKYVQISPDIGGLEISELGTHNVVFKNTDTVDNTYKITISSP
jgi:alpha-tubulin suppressor-like RCC1 family protein